MFDACSQGKSLSPLSQIVQVRMVPNLFTQTKPEEIFLSSAIRQHGAAVRRIHRWRYCRRRAGAESAVNNHLQPQRSRRH